MKNFVKISLFYTLLCLGITTTNAEIIERWQEIKGTFELKHATKQEAVVHNSIVEQLIRQNGVKLDNVVAEDGETVHYFSISYNAPLVLSGGKQGTKVQRITQYGLYRTLDTELRTALKSHVSPMMITVRYDIEQPTSFKFVINNTVYTTPTLIHM